MILIARREWRVATHTKKEAIEENLLRVGMMDLAKTKEELRQTKNDVARSWLEVRPLINDLERLKSNLATAKSRILMSNAVISELETELQTTENSIKFKKEIEKKLKLKTVELNQSLDRKREEIEDLELKKGKQRRSRTELKQALRLKRQSLKTLQLRLRATRLETEAIRKSVKGAVKSIYCSETDTTTIEISHEEYCLLMKKAEEETLLADWRVSVTIEQRLVAEGSRNSALRRLKEKSEKKFRESENNEQKSKDLYAIKDGNKEKSKIKAEIEPLVK